MIGIRFDLRLGYGTQQLWPAVRGKIVEAVSHVLAEVLGFTHSSYHDDLGYFSSVSSDHLRDQIINLGYQRTKGGDEIREIKSMGDKSLPPQDLNVNVAPVLASKLLLGFIISTACDSSRLTTPENLGAVEPIAKLLDQT